MTMRYYIVDAFTDRPFGGNPAGVVLLGEDAFPDEGLMTQVAAELRFSETAFVRRLAPTEYHLRYFTPKTEVELCGHATIATFSLLHSLGMAEGECRCRTLAGDLCVEAGEKVMMQMAAPHIVRTISDTAPIYKALGIDGYRPTLPVQVAYAGLEDIMIPIPDVETLNALHPDMEAVAALTEKHKAVSFHCFALPNQTIRQSSNQTISAHVRDFAPQYGIPEESATGTANAALAHYLSIHGAIPACGDFSFMQGEAMGRPSVVATRISADGRIYVGGTAAAVAKGEINAAPKQLEFCCSKTAQFRQLRTDEIPLLDNFLYEAIFIPDGVAAPPKSIIENEELQVYVRDFGRQKDDRCLVAECDGKVVGAVWTRVMDDYGHIADGIPSLAMSLYKDYRNKGIGTALLEQMLQLLREEGYRQVSLSVQKENYAVRMYRKVGFVVLNETNDEYIMVHNL